jgi:hypothetical protein
VAGRWAQEMQVECDQLRPALAKQEFVVSMLVTNVISLVQRMLRQAKARRRLLASYVRILPTLTATAQRDDNTFIVTAPFSDDTMQIKMDALKNRLRDVFAHQQNAPLAADVTSLILTLQRLLNQFGKSTPLHLETIYLQL